MNDAGKYKDSPKLLIVDDEEFVREAMELYFASEGYEVVSASGGHRALEIVRKESISLALLDILMPEMDGIQLLREIKKVKPEIEIVMVTGCSTIKTAVEAMRLGAYDYVTKPITNFEEDLLKVVKKALERRDLLRANRELTNDLREINRELKSSNSQLKRHMAELELLHETVRMLTELDSFAKLLELTSQTILHHLGVKHSILLLEERSHFCAFNTNGKTSANPVIIDLDSPALGAPPFSFEDRSILMHDYPDFQELVSDLGKPVSEAQYAMMFPLRVQGQSHGMLVTLHPGEIQLTESEVSFMKLLASQISAPLALHREKVAY